MRTIRVSPEFPLNYWILIAAILLAVICVLPVYAEDVSESSTWMAASKWIGGVLTDAVVGVVAGMATVVLASWLGIKNFRKGMRYNKMAEVYERLLSALQSEKNADDIIDRYLRHPPHDIPPEKAKHFKQENNKAKNEWNRAMVDAELYLDPTSVELLRKCHEKIEVDDEVMGMSLFMRGPVQECIDAVKKQAQKDLHGKK